ncbi:Cyclic AMP-dependent transcription factor ATF-6 beta, putative [Pediculus humanus corporis]|uniref:Cyclic AMP-dependent transcription factor ATF-6 beta, putative n=1 Tax=Pediculus humanus subsp. corporis TaxID=121224 RepID=E0VKG4_PEDHC|nr:Cyclic AMP-dependent transcription factor ATF-6 beta, putative [Pediculus humanus corporis]EEB13844.1 Cyclic AMP-dependent transcription factor ATF-6 beta, putative [Pediculus humanus corporis]
MVLNSITEVFRGTSDSDLQEWSAAFLDVKPQVILHDRLMTDAALGTVPIKTEHSYSLNSDGDSSPDSPISLDRIDDMDEECFPAISLNTATGRCQSKDGKITPVSIKDEPLSCPASPESCPMSPDSSDSYVQRVSDPPPPFFLLTPPFNKIKKKFLIVQTRKPMLKPCGQSVLKQPALLLPRGVYSKLNIKLEPGTGFTLPPTPPSSTTSDSESIPSESTELRRNSRVYLSSSSRQPIHTPLISSQPKGSTGILMLTEEEKRTLMAEGYPVPTRLPLTKQEEKSLKKIRRKIKNKISAQESRRKKKEYMDTLERKVETLQSENAQYKKKLDTLEDDNASLLSQLQKLQATLARRGGCGGGSGGVGESSFITVIYYH